MLIAVWPLVIAIVGVLVYFVSANGKVQEVGRLLFAIGMLWLVYALTGHTLKLG